MNICGVSIIICCFNSELRIKEVLEFLFNQQDLGEISWEIIVVNNGSTDNTSEVVSSEFESMPGMDCRLVYEANPGLMYARNKGIALAKYEYLLFCDDDNLLCDTYVKGVFTIMTSNNQIGACGGKGIELIRDCEKPEWFNQFKRNYAVGSQVTDPQLTLYGAGMCIRYSAMQEIRKNGFIPFLTGRIGNNLLAGDDSELILALRLSGYHLVASDEFFFWHLLPFKRLNRQYLGKMAVGFGMTMPVISIYNLCLYKKKVFSSFYLIAYFLVNSIKSFGVAIKNKGLYRQFFLSYAYGQLKGIRLFRNDLSKISVVVKSISKLVITMSFIVLQ